jgi:succinate-semialdehyde dehydrogenase / glutarate-semialdehyde dehydrogenase
MQARVVHDEISTINPAIGQIIHSYETTDIEQISCIVSNARTAFAKWKKKDVVERCDYIRSLAKVLNKNRDRYSKIITQEMGKPISPYAEIEKCIWLCEYYCENAESFLQDQIIPTEFRKSFVSFEPLGIVIGIMPWNFPFWQVMRFVVPPLIAGNVAILKHSSVCIGSSLNIRDSLNDAGFPENVFQIVVGDYRAGEALVQSKIDAVSVTGSVSTGKRVAELAARDYHRVARDWIFTS